jgi:hypothetical protein
VSPAWNMPDIRSLSPGFGLYCETSGPKYTCRVAFRKSWVVHSGGTEQKEKRAGEPLPLSFWVDAWLLDWITRESFRRSDFFETATGNCRLMSSICGKLSETTPIWGKMAAPYAERVASLLWARASRSAKLAHPNLATPLTQAHRREAKGAPSSKAEAPTPDTLCRGCGKQIPRGKRHCQQCAVPLTRHNFDAGRKIAQQPESIAKRSATQRRHKQAIQNWNPAKVPTWLTRDVYVKQIQPALTAIPKSRIREALGVSEPYSIFIQAGQRIPHPRHWQALAQLVGVSPAHA